MSMKFENTSFRGLDAIRISNGGSVVVVTLFGAHVCSWTLDGEEQLFLSSLAKFDQSKAIRGGIPVVFPQFGRPNEIMAQHGFARNSIWTFVEDGDASYLSLTDNEETKAVWPHSFRLTLSLTIEARNMKIDMSVENLGTNVLECHTLLHTYFRVADITKTCVKGFGGLAYKDHLGDHGTRQNEGETNIIDREVDREYQDYPQDKKVSVVCDADSKQFDIQTKATLDGNPTSFDVVFWSPWIDKCKATGDLDDDAYKRYVCIEPGTIADLKRVEAGSKLHLSKTIKVV